MISSRMAIIVSAMIDKMDIDIKDIEGKDQEDIGEKLISTLIRKLYKAEDEVYRLIAEYKGISKEEAAKADFVAIIKEIASDIGLVTLFT